MLLPSALLLMGWGLAAALLLALWIDRGLGEPPARWHPVVWMGHYLGWVGARLAPSRDQPGGPDHRRWLLGALAWLAGGALVGGLAVALQRLCVAAPALLGWVLLGVLLKPMLAWRMLATEVQAVETALGQSLAQGRERLAWLVSRDVHTLSEVAVRESALESLAENLNDSVVAPLFWFVLLGLPGAALYRFANTADAMWGYRGIHRGREWEWAGKWAARADDVLSWVPARLTAGLLALARGGLAWRTLWREAQRTPSPNGGWPMAALALALDVTLRKPGVYALHDNGRLAQPDDTARALRLAARAVWLALVLGVGVIWLWQEVRA